MKVNAMQCFAKRNEQNEQNEQNERNGLEDPKNGLCSCDSFTIFVFLVVSLNVQEITVKSFQLWPQYI